MSKASIFVLILVTVAGALADISPNSKIQISLLNTFLKNGKADVLVSFEHGIQPAINSLNLKRASRLVREERLQLVASTLKAHMASTQKRVLDYLNSCRSLNYRTLWITNQLIIKDADLSLIRSLSTFKEVSQILEDQRLPQDHMQFAERSTAPKAYVPEPGLTIIRAPEAWALPGGNNGTGARVGTIDTGVRLTHKALYGSFSGAYGWYDPYTHTPAPIDDVGQGTHTMGTILGGGGIGVAPGASWITCRGCDFASCSQAALLECGQFIACPTTANGEEEDCSLAPYVVSNGWRGAVGDTFFADVIAVWTLQGISTVFGVGGTGPACYSAHVPGDNVISVGITTLEDSLADRSARGPYGSLLKPDLVGPGENIRSASNSGDEDYMVLSAASMSASHVTGVIALLKAARPALSHEELYWYLTSFAGRDFPALGEDCGGLTDTDFPNNGYGYGRVDARESLAALLAYSVA